MIMLPMNWYFSISEISFNLTQVNISDGNGIQTHNHLVRKETLNHLPKFWRPKVKASLAKWLSVRLQTNWLYGQIPWLSLKLQILRLFQARSSLRFSNYWVLIHSERYTWQDNSMQTSKPFYYVPSIAMSE